MTTLNKEELYDIWLQEAPLLKPAINYGEVLVREEFIRLQNEVMSLVERYGKLGVFLFDISKHKQNTQKIIEKILFESGKEGLNRVKREFKAVYFLKDLEEFLEKFKPWIEYFADRIASHTWGKLIEYQLKYQGDEFLEKVKWFFTHYCFLTRTRRIALTESFRSYNAVYLGFAVKEGAKEKIWISPNWKDPNSKSGKLHAKKIPWWDFFQYETISVIAPPLHPLDQSILLAV